jgi:hypothetical protein
MEERRDTWTPAGKVERHDPLPSFVRLPVHAWRKLSPRARLAAAALALTAALGIAVVWPYVERDKRAGEEQRAAEAAERRQARTRELIEDQRPRHAVLSDSARQEIAGSTHGLQSPAAALLAGAELAAAIERDVSARIEAGKLDGPLLRATCDPVAVRSRRAANYNCFALTHRDRAGGRVLDFGYRFSARTELPATLVWCKENPRPLHPTSYVISVPISRECR